MCCAGPGRLDPKRSCINVPNRRGVHFSCGGFFLIHFIRLFLEALESDGGRAADGRRLEPAGWSGCTHTLLGSTLGRPSTSPGLHALRQESLLRFVQIAQSPLKRATVHLRGSADDGMK